MNGVQTAFPFLLLVEVAVFPIMMNISRERDMKTFKRSGAAINPTSSAPLLRVRVAMTMSLYLPCLIVCPRKYINTAIGATESGSLPIVDNRIGRFTC
jgi:hypothetical protein